MPQRTLYVRDADEPVWKAASRLAQRDNISLSQLVTDALEAHLPQVADQPARADRWAAVAADQPKESAA